MRVLGIRYCTVSPGAEALAGFLDALGLPRQILPPSPDDAGFTGAVFPAGDSWVEVWPDSEEMPAGTMLQIIVDDADAFADSARANGIEPSGPVDAHGERIYFFQAPSGLAVTVQSRGA